MKLEIAAGANPQTDHTWAKHDQRYIPGIDLVCDWRDIEKELIFKGVFKLEEIYNRHFIEHLDPVEGLAFLELCHRILIEGGRFTVLCPNMKWLCEKYLAGDYSDVSEFVCWMFGGGYDAGWSYHKSAYDCDLLCRAMRTVGFEIEEYDSVGFLLEVIGVRR